MDTILIDLLKRPEDSEANLLCKDDSNDSGEEEDRKTQKKVTKWNKDSDSEEESPKKILRCFLCPRIFHDWSKLKYHLLCSHLREKAKLREVFIIF